MGRTCIDGNIVSIKLARQQHTSLFVGQWAAPFLLLGIYNKLVSNMCMKLKNNNMPSVGRFESTDGFLCIDSVCLAVKASVFKELSSIKNLFL